MYLLFNQVNFFNTNDKNVCAASLYSYNWYQMSKFDVNLFHVISPMKKDRVWWKVHDSSSCIKRFHIFCKSWICLRYSNVVRKHSKHSFDIEAVGFSTASSTLNSLDLELIFSPILQAQKVNNIDIRNIEKKSKHWQSPTDHINKCVGIEYEWTTASSGDSNESNCGIAAVQYANSDCWANLLVA